MNTRSSGARGSNALPGQIFPQSLHDLGTRTRHLSTTTGRATSAHRGTAKQGLVPRLRTVLYSQTLAIRSSRLVQQLAQMRFAINILSMSNTQAGVRQIIVF